MGRGKPGRLRLIPKVGWMCLVWFIGLNNAEARVRLEHLCIVQGQQEVRLTGVGLVTGLKGTGDGAKSLPTLRALRSALSRLHQPVQEIELKQADSVAMVLVEAIVPRTGLRRGQKVDAHVSTLLGAKSLRGGRLLTTPLTATEGARDVVVALAAGSLVIEDAAQPTTARILLGVDLRTDVHALFLSAQEQPTVTLLIEPQHASFFTANEVANVINREFTFEAGGRPIARPISPIAVELQVPPQYREAPVEFIALVLDIGIDIPTTHARVVLDSKSGTVIVTGEVEISPVVIAHKSFTIQVLPSDQPSTGPFVAFKDGPGRQAPQQLNQLIDALNQLRVPAEDIINIIRTLHQTGKLHAELIER
ncbi:MAG: flagellar P-ring protein [Planctomycetaceae bacterium]|nr:MAG: flagellar P-ring protein [Planctomycetaceae bacterium]